MGSQLRKIRERRKISLHRAATDTRIQIPILEALEKGEPTGLHEEYEAGVRASYRRYLGLPAVPHGAAQKAAASVSAVRRPAIRPKRTLATETLIRRFTLLALAMLVVGYGIWQLLSLVSAPRLDIGYPPGDTIVREGVVEIRGQTSSGAEVFINGESILIEPDGKFTETVTLRPGLNDVEIVAVNALAKRAVIHRSIVFQPPDHPTH